MHDQRGCLVGAALGHGQNVHAQAVYLFVKLLFITGIQSQKAEENGDGYGHTEER